MEKRAYQIHLAGFAAYAALVAYLLVRNLEETPLTLAAYVLAMMCHFLAVDHSLREEHGHDVSFAQAVNPTFPI